MALLLILTIYASTINVDTAYRDVFKEEIIAANRFIGKNEKSFEGTAIRFGLSTQKLKALVFPELIRYSAFRDLMETRTLEWLYIEGGSSSADFSIGSFQMKPSFVEELEAYVSSNPSVKKEYGFISRFDSGSPIRKQRIERLKSLSWQLIYLSAFIEGVENKFSSILKETEEKQLRFLASAYNGGFSRTEEEIWKASELKCFPYGPKFNADQFVYGDIVVDYYFNNNQ